MAKKVSRIIFITRYFYKGELIETELGSVKQIPLKVKAGRRERKPKVPGALPQSAW